VIYASTSKAVFVQKCFIDDAFNEYVISLNVWKVRSYAGKEAFQADSGSYPDHGLTFAIAIVVAENVKEWSVLISVRTDAKMNTFFHDVSSISLLIPYQRSA